MVVQRLEVEDCAFLGIVDVLLSLAAKIRV